MWQGLVGVELKTDCAMAPSLSRSGGNFSFTAEVGIVAGEGHPLGRTELLQSSLERRWGVTYLEKTNHSREGEKCNGNSEVQTPTKTRKKSIKAKQANLSQT